MRDSMKTFWRGTDAARSEKVVAVGPGSLKVQPPIAIKIRRFGSFCFRSVRRLYKATSVSNEGRTLKLTGLIVANAKLMWVYKPTGICSGQKTLQARFVTQPS